MSNYVHVRLMMDNTSAIACVNNFGSMVDNLMAVTREMYEWALARRIYLSAAYIPSKENILANKESHTQTHDKEWNLKPKWLEYIMSKFD